jgi:site-specific DNA recombinase
MKPSTKRCAIYTRKSTEEGLEQEFNSLHAQREACQAYIVSQKSEGWIAIKTHYDDGGFSGGNIDRPALKQLIEDIKSRKIGIVVVYKIDRLTRSLMDFSKLVELFDQYGVTFVSITQSFNTTTSMGRLTLNVLLSFAQFEREVIGERVRDKVEASKKKGMWMGGVVPLGYDVKDKKLTINTKEAETVRLIYDAYLKLGSVSALKKYLDKNNIKGKERQGKVSVPYSRGNLYSILVNPLYKGQIRYKEKIYEGRHEAIISEELWDCVQQRMTEQVIGSRTKTNDRIDTLLRGKLFDCDGNRYTPSYTVKNKKRYRYYISQNLLQNRDHPKHIIARIPSESMEKAICETIDKCLSNHDKLAVILDIDINNRNLIDFIIQHSSKIAVADIINIVVNKIIIHPQEMRIHVIKPELAALIEQKLKLDLSPPANETHIEIIPFSTRRAEKGTLVIAPQSHDRQKTDPFVKTPLELKNWVRGVIWREEFFSGTMIADIAKREKMGARHVGRLIEASLDY